MVLPPKSLSAQGAFGWATAAEEKANVANSASTTLRIAHSLPDCVPVHPEFRLHFTVSSPIGKDGFVQHNCPGFPKAEQPGWRRCERQAAQFTRLTVPGQDACP